MPITLQEIKDHQDCYGLQNIDNLSIKQYKEVLNNNAFFIIDSDSNLRHNFSGEIIASNKQQLDILMDHLKLLRAKVS